MRKCKIKSVLHRVLTLFVAKGYQQLYHLDKEKRLMAEEMEEAIVECVGSVTLPPQEAYDKMYVYEYGSNEDEVLVEIYLWVDGEESEWTLKCEILQDKNEVYFSIQDILVM